MEKEATSVAIATLGCRLNQAEAEAMGRSLRQRGCQLVKPLAKADLCIVNTCAVTHVADRKSRHLLRSMRRRNPQAIVVATGCYTERPDARLTQMGEIDLVLTNAFKEDIAQVLERKSGLPMGCPSHHTASADYPARTRAFVKIQEGCNDSCSYCVVPQTRGHERSVPADIVVREVRARIEEGYQEVLLTGTNVGAYKSHNGPSGSVELHHLLRRILAETPLARLRLSSLQPQEISEELLEAWHDERLCRHFHLPLQSGSNTVLRRMGRRYSSEDYEAAVRRIRAMVPSTTITTDIIVGFPGTSEVEFEDSYRFCTKMGFAGIHVFPFSARGGTTARQMPNQLDEKTKERRSKTMLDLASKESQSSRRQFLGDVVDVLWEANKDGLWSGLSSNYLRVFTRSQEALHNRITPARIVGESSEGLLAEPGPRR